MSVLCHSVKWDKCFVYLNQLKQLCVESLPCWITVYAFAITYICRVSLMINQELVWLSKLRQNGGKKIRLLYMSDTRGKNLPFVISYRILNCQGRNGPCYTYFQIGKIRLLVISFKSEGKPKNNLVKELSFVFNISILCVQSWWWYGNHLLDEGLCLKM